MLMGYAHVMDEWSSVNHWSYTMCDLGGTINPCEMPLILNIIVGISVVVLSGVAVAVLATSISLFKSLRS